MPQALATDLPAGVLNYLRQKDPNVKVRFDGLVFFSNGETYVPVIPQDPSLSPDAQHVVMSVPEKAPYPDLVEFDNHFFLMRLIQTQSGRLTFPKMAEYPIQLKEGLLPQDFVLPNNLFIPVELKVLLGALPYNPTYEPPKVPVIVPPSVVLGGAVENPARPTAARRATYVFDLNAQKAIAIDPLTGKKQGDVSLECVPASLKLSADGRLLFAPCLSTDELVVVDTSSNLVKTRVPVGGRPDSVAFVPETRQVAVSNRFSPFVSLIDSDELMRADRISLPGNGGAMAVVPGRGERRLLVADAVKPQIYVVDAASRTVTATYKSLPNISVLRVVSSAQGRPEIWAASRSKHQVQVLDLADGAVLKTLDVGKKPVDMAMAGDKLYVVSAGDDRVDVIDLRTQALVSDIALEPGGFPSGLFVLPSEQRAYVTMAGTQSLVVLDLSAHQVAQSVPVEFRAGMITMTPDPEPEPSAVVKAAPSLPALVDEESAPQAGKTVAEPGKADDAEKSGFLNKLWGRKTAEQPDRKPSATSRPQSSEARAPGAASRQPAAFSVMPDDGSRIPAQGGGQFTFRLSRDAKEDTDAESAAPVARPEASPQPDAPVAVPDMLEERLAD